MDKSAVEKTQMKEQGNEWTKQRTDDWMIDWQGEKKNQIKWHRIGKERLFAPFDST